MLRRAEARTPPVDGALRHTMWVESGVRTAVEDVGREVSLAAGAAAGGSGHRLAAAWGRLVDVLAIGPAPELRACPHCGAEGMRAATLCGVCWKDLTPPPMAAAAAPGAP
jgi:hypothetical protein